LVRGRGFVLCIFCIMWKRKRLYGTHTHAHAHTHTRFIEEYEVTKYWFIGLGKDKNEILEKVWDEKLSDSKGKVLRKLWKERKRESNK